MNTPTNIQLVGDEIAIAWDDGTESFLRVSELRAASPSAENKGETDILGVRHGGTEGPASFEGVRLLGWQKIGNYAIRFDFSDGHNSGLYAYDYLKNIRPSA